MVMGTITTGLYLDGRNVGNDNPAPVKVRVRFKKTTFFISTSVRVLRSQWDSDKCIVVSHPKKVAYNNYLTGLLTRIQSLIMKMQLSGEIQHVAPNTLKEILSGGDGAEVGAFLKKYESFMASRNAAGTREAYRQTLSRLRAFDQFIDTRSFEDIDKDYLLRFDAFLARTCCRNARNVHYRNIRAVFNDAIDDEITTAYPFRKFKLKTEPTRKRSLSVEELRVLRDYPVEDYQRKYRDIFMLMFYLIGVNAVDLLNAPKNAIRNGRLEYTRAKTHKGYSIKVEPEAQEIIDRYAGKKYLIDVMDTYSNYKDWLHRMGKALKEIGECRREWRGGKKVRTPLFPDLSQYWCRHTWATTAAELDIPKETIAAGLGHGSNTVTDIYIKFDYKKVDVANRRVIDYVNSDEVL